MADGLLREGVLDGVRALLAMPEGGLDGAPVARAVAHQLAELGGRVVTCELAPSGLAADEEALGALVDEALAPLGGAELLVVDGAGLFGAAAIAAQGEDAALLASMQATWELTRGVAAAAMIEDGGGLVVLVAPAPGAGAHAEAARAGLENLARTLSIEWARFGTRAVAVAAGDATSAAEIAELVAYLASPAGAYYSGCQLDLRGVRAATGANLPRG